MDLPSALRGDRGRAGAAPMTPTNPKVICSGPDCDRPAQRGGLCWGHRGQRQRHEALAPLRRRSQRRWDVVLEAALAYAEAESEEAFRKARARIRKAVARYLAAVDAGLETDSPDEGESEP